MPNSVSSDAGMRKPEDTYCRRQNAAKQLRDLTMSELYAALEADVWGAETEFSLRDCLACNPKIQRDSVEPAFVLKERATNERGKH